MVKFLSSHNSVVKYFFCSLYFVYSQDAIWLQKFGMLLGIVSSLPLLSSFYYFVLATVQVSEGYGFEDYVGCQAPGQIITKSIEAEKYLFCRVRSKVYKYSRWSAEWDFSCSDADQPRRGFSAVRIYVSGRTPTASGINFHFVWLARSSARVGSFLTRISR